MRFILSNSLTNLWHLIFNMPRNLSDSFTPNEVKSKLQCFLTNQFFFQMERIYAFVSLSLISK